jgi:hypothetical protein
MQRSFEMTSNTGDNQEVLVLNDHEGNWYAIPREIVERHRATAAQKAEIEQVLGNDVQGFQMREASKASGLSAEETDILRRHPIGVPYGEDDPTLPEAGATAQGTVLARFVHLGFGRLEL